MLNNFMIFYFWLQRNRFANAPLSHGLLISSVVYAVMLLLLLPTKLYAANEDESKLQSIQQHIIEKEKSIQLQQQQRERLLNQLQSQEKAIATVSCKLRNTQHVLAAVKKEIAQLNTVISQGQKQQTEQEKLLSQQLDAAFRLGRHHSLQLLLSNDHTLRSERILAYFGYLNKARQQNIDSLQQTRSRLVTQKAALVEKQTRQQSLLSQQQSQQNQLQKTRNARQKTIKELEFLLKKNQTQLVEMHQNQSRLQENIANAEREARARIEHEKQQAEQVRSRQQQAKKKGTVYKPTTSERELMARTGGLGSAAGQALWPIHGKTLHHFGEILYGELIWKGLVIKAPEGAEVKAIADGRVIMADWLQGYGLVVVVEHGKGDMSLYGYNQRTLVNAGTQVKAGEPIALVGNSGGQGTSSLYFEIRRQGQTVNPLFWLRK